MKKMVTMMAIILYSVCNANAQEQELQQLFLNTQKLAQFKQILRDMKSGYDIISKGYGTIKNISEGNYKLHQAFLDGLLQISPAVRKYNRVGEIIKYQTLLVKEYKYSAAIFNKVPYYSPSELKYLNRIYDSLLKQSLRNLNELAGVMTAGQLRMTDDERIQAIDRIYIDMEQKVSFLRHFNNETKILGVNRAKENSDLKVLDQLYGINK